MTVPLTKDQIKHIFEICEDDDIEQALIDLRRKNNVCTP